MGSDWEVGHEHSSRFRKTARNSDPGRESPDPAMGGATRIPVWVLEQARRLGISEADLLRSYPTLRAEDLTNAWAYVRSHRSEIDLAIRENEEA